MSGARRAARAGVAKQEHAMLRDEGLAHDDILAAGPRQAADEPIVLDFYVADRQQEKCAVLRPCSARGCDEGAEPGPARMVAAAGEGPFAAQHVAAIRRRRGAGRGKTGTAERIGAIAP